MKKIIMLIVTLAMMLTPFFLVNTDTDVKELLAGDLLLYDDMSKGETKKLIASALDGDPQAIEKLKAFQKTLQADQSDYKPNVKIEQAQSVIGSIRMSPEDDIEISIGMSENKGGSTNWSSTAASTIERALELSGKS